MNDQFLLFFIVQYKPALISVAFILISNVSFPAQDEEPPEPMDVDETALAEEIPDREASIDSSLVFREHKVPDAAPYLLNSSKNSFSKFTLPTKEDGFDEVRYVWDDRETSENYLNQWKASKMKDLPVPGFTPGDLFKLKKEEWGTQQTEWRKKWNAFKAGEDAKKKDKPAEENTDESEELSIEKQIEDIDVWACDDILNAVGEAPLFAFWKEEDWRVAQLRHDLTAMFHCFKTDVNDETHPGITKKTFADYFGKYFDATWDSNRGGRPTDEAFWESIMDTLDEEDGILVAQQDQDVPLDVFVRATEEARRERVAKIAAGDDSAKLKFDIPTRRVVSSSSGPPPRTAPGRSTLPTPPPPRASMAARTAARTLARARARDTARARATAATAAGATDTIPAATAGTTIHTQTFTNQF